MPVEFAELRLGDACAALGSWALDAANAEALCGAAGLYWWHLPGHAALARLENALPSDTPILIYGAGSAGVALSRDASFTRLSGRIAGWLDRRADELNGNLGHPVYHPDKIRGLPPFPIIVIHPTAEAEIVASLLELGVAHDRIFPVYSEPLQLFEASAFLEQLNRQEPHPDRVLLIGESDVPLTADPDASDIVPEDCRPLVRLSPRHGLRRLLIAATLLGPLRVQADARFTAAQLAALLLGALHPGVHVSVLHAGFLHESRHEAETAARKALLVALAHDAFTPRLRLPDSASTAHTLQLTDIRSWCRRGNGNYHRLQDAEPFPVQAALKDAHRNLLAAGGTVMQKELYVAEIGPATVLGRSDLIFCGAYAIHDCVLDPEDDKYSLASEACLLARTGRTVTLTLPQAPSLVLDCAITLCGRRTEEFGHWLTEYLPRWQLIERVPDFATWPVLVEEGMPASHYELLRHYIGPDHRVICVPHQGTVRVGRLAVPGSFVHVRALSPSLPQDYRHYPISPMISRDLRDRLTAFAPHASGRRRLYLARRHTYKRRLENQEEIENLLETLGFETLHLEDFPIAEQVRYIREAEWIVAPNASSLYLAAACNRACRTVVLSQKYLANWVGWASMMHDVGLHATFVVGEGAVQGFEKHADYRIDPDELKKALAVIEPVPPIRILSTNTFTR